MNSRSLLDASDQAIAHLAAGGFIAYPTETVWGLGACADQSPAIERLMAWKGRGPSAPLAVLVASQAAAEAQLDCRFTPSARRLAEAFWPGPLMLVVPCTRRFAAGVAGANGALGLRCSSHSVARVLAERLHAAGLGPLTSTSLNRSGDPPATTRAEAQACLRAAGDSPGAADRSQPLLWAEAGYDAGGAAPSSVVDCTGETPKILRVGAIERSQIEEQLKR